MLAASRCCSSHSSSSLRSLRRHLSTLQTHLLLSSFHPTTTNRCFGANAAGDGGNQPVNWWRRVEFSTNASSSTMGGKEEDINFVNVEIRCRKREADVLSEALLCYGASSASMDELSDCEDDDDEICISSIFTNHQDAHACISLAADSIGLKKAPSYEIRVGEEYNWLKNAKESFHPIEVADELWIVPQWRTPPDSRATNIILNPGMAFGTGEHPTTKLCLLLLNGLIKGGEFLLDYGTGSGILGIAALKMGASLSVGVDMDPQAILSAQQNIALNQINPDRMQLYLSGSKVISLPSDGRASDDKGHSASCNSGLSIKRGTFDIILANILLNPLLELAEEIVSYGKPGAVIGLSGILTEQLPQLERCYSRYLERISTSEIDGWALLSGIKM